MSVPKTALQHFDDDIGRAKALLAHADSLPTATSVQQTLRSDILRSAWMFAVGSLDAYFCDAYTDVIAASLIAKRRQPSVTLPDFFLNIKLPVRAILEEYDSRDNWRWRMAARDLMEKEHVLSLATIQKLFNKFCRKGHKFFNDVIERWIAHQDARQRLFGMKYADYQKLTGKEKDQARRDADAQLADRFDEIFQRRHDCIHNCDRPRNRPQKLNISGSVLKVIQDVEFLVMRCDEHLNSEIREFLRGCGCTQKVCKGVGY